MEALDVLAAQGLAAARAVVQAVHDPGPWTVCWAGFEVPAERRLHEASVTFRAVLAGDRPLCGSAVAELRCRGEGVRWREVRDPGVPFELEWELAPPVPVDEAA